jgi:hypothetical protein
MLAGTGDSLHSQLDGESSPQARPSMKFFDLLSLN